MRAVVVTSAGGPGAVRVRDLPEPVCDPDQVLIDVRAAGVVYPDVLQSWGRYQTRFEFPFVLGQECAGVVRWAPERSSFRVGDRVAALLDIGAFAETVVAEADRVLPLPDEVSFDEGACLPVNYLTAHFALSVRGRLRAGETVLVHGAAGGVGIACVQLAVALGATVFAVTSTPAKAALARWAGAHEVLPAKEFRQQLAGRRVDVVVDPVGGDRFTDSLRCLSGEGRLLVVGFTAGQIPAVKVNRLLLTNTEVVGVGWGAYGLGRPGYAAQQWAELLPWWESRRLLPPIGETFPFEDVEKALAAVDERRALGKIVLRPGKWR
ncbi:NADPH:quinone oxidoreductase family protein [Amycolatopsis sp. K13G38]|uniref:NADPH:quinone oxidoreductase family protein n=1 Tax=Amycolatopsis acididurans TaxID=2724524 RepID=A0ABX1JAZ7_9PSEU|nr:NADPH:quinone oxidoreductase family protein [Amycolatopsis acididurans]NKQ56967.1 NADPH:quinone oxidoreductase family protein [Amycolatopsis acididurans]